MTPLETLELFCDKTSRFMYRNAVSRGPYSYSSNGIVCIRVPRVAGVLDDAKNQYSTVEQGMFDPAAKYEAMSVLLPGIVQSACALCLGSQVVQTCPDCDAGTVTWETERGFEYEHRCECCNGHGYLQVDTEQPQGKHVPCPNCIDGKVDAPGQNFVWRGVPYSLMVMHTIARLPGVQLAIITTPLSARPLRFIFDGGDGVVMPVRA